MRSECIEAVTQAIGRPLNAQEVQGIEDRLSRHMRDVARRDPAEAQSKPYAERLADAATAAAQELVGEAALKKRRLALSIVAHDKVQRFLDGSDDPLRALRSMLAFHAEARENVLSIESQADAIRNDALRQMIDTLEATNPKFFGLFEDNAGIRDLVRELHGQDTGNADAAAGAKAFHELSDRLRERFNRGGGDVGKRDDWGMPHHHSQVLVARAGKEAWLKLSKEERKAYVDQLPPKERRAYGKSKRYRSPPNAWAREHWINDILPLLNRQEYVNPDGTLMNNQQVREFLGEAWTTIATGAANKIEPGQFRGNGMRANRGNAARQIHFKSGDAYLDYAGKYNDKPVYDTLIGHVSQMARDIAMVETLGPNPDHLFAFFRDKALKEASELNAIKAGKANSHADSLDNLYRYVGGNELPVASERLAKFFDAFRNWLTASYLGSSYLTSFSDNATLYLTAHVNNLPAMQVFRNQLATLNIANQMEKRLALRAGLAMNAYIGNLNRFGSEMLGGGFSRRLANTTLRASGLIAATEARKRAFGVTFMSALGQVTRDAKTLDALDAGDWRILKSKGITSEDWEVWRRATPEDWGGGNDTMLTPDSIYKIPDEQLADLGDPRVLKEQATTRLLGAINEESHMAVIEPGARERSMMKHGTQRGTWKGELARSVLLFKSFPIAMITRHFLRGINMPTGAGKTAYLSALLAGTTVAGMASLQAYAVAKGEDPRNMNPFTERGLKTWVAALLKGGALSLYGDFLFQDQTRYGATPFESLAGPVLGTGADLLKIGQEAFYEGAGIQKENLGADITRFVTGRIPLINMWYTRAALNHMWFHQMQEHYSPGYLRRMKRRKHKKFGTTFWWEPQSRLPDRLPNPEAAVGEHP